YAGGDREDVGTEDEVLGRNAEALGEQALGAGADRHAPLDGVGLALLVQGHDHRGRPVAAELAGVLEEELLAYLQADRVHDRLALYALQARLDHRPLRGVDHDT